MSSSPLPIPNRCSRHREGPRVRLADWVATRSGLLAELARDELADITRSARPSTLSRSASANSSAEGRSRRCWPCPAAQN